MLNACSVYTHVPKGSQLVAKVKIKGAPKQYNEGLDLLIEEKPNTKILGFWRLRTRLWFVTEKIRKRKNKEENTIWELPNYYSEASTDATVAKMESYLKNKGYFNAKVRAEKKSGLFRKKSVVVKYHVNEKMQYLINDVDRNVEDFDIYTILELDKNKSLLKRGLPFSSTSVGLERERIFKLMRESGYYNFSKAYVYFDLDSTLANHRVDVAIGVKNPGLYSRHQVYKIGQINFLKIYEGAIDSSKNVELEKGVYRTGIGNRNADEILLRSLVFNSGDIYKQSSIESSLKNLKKLEQYQYVEVFYEVAQSEKDTAILDISIKLTPYDRWQIQLQTEAITSESNVFSPNQSPTLGIGGSIVFKDNNFLSRGILMENRMSGSYESSINDGQKRTPFKEFSLNNNFYFSKPFLSGILPASFQNNIYQSTLTLNGFLEDNPSFLRSTANIGVGYVVQKGKFRHNILPVNFSLISANITSDSFQNFINLEGNSYLQNLFDNHTIAGSKWGLYYTNKTIAVDKNYFEISANVIELAGSIFNLSAKLIGKDAIDERQTTFNKTLLGMHFFQYAKFDYDFRFHQKLDREAEMVYRGFVGVVYPFGNTPSSTPFERRYVLGGANSIRGWGIRQIGPGASKITDGSSDIFSQTGEIKLEGNLEYRFSLGPLLKMALFTDFGNIWDHKSTAAINEEDLRSFKNNYMEIAVAAGLGLRFDFTYFVFRTDFGVPLRDPSLQLGDNINSKWFYSDAYKNELGNLSLNPVQINIGIGYPF